MTNSEPDPNSDEKDVGKDDQPKITLGLESADRIVIVLLCGTLVAAVGLFFWFVDNLDLLTYPTEKLENAVAESRYNYFGQALEYRERRLSLALTYRTFITSFGFTVGLVLATIGGIFVLRRANSEFSAKVGPLPNGVDTESDIQRLKASVKTNSPGIVFMLSGTAVIIVTQMLAIPVGAPEIFPLQSQILCDPSAEKEGTCWTTNPSSKLEADEKLDVRIEALDSFCHGIDEGSDAESQSFCQTYNELANGG